LAEAAGEGFSVYSWNATMNGAGAGARRFGRDELDAGGAWSPRRHTADGDSLTDEQLLADHLAGGPSSFGELVRRYRGELSGFLFHVLGNRATVEDVLQETFLRVHRSAKQFDPSRKFRAWVFTIAANAATDVLRRQSGQLAGSLDAAVHRGATAEGPTRLAALAADDAHRPDRIAVRQEQRTLVHRALDCMPDHLRRIVVLAYFQQLSYQEISRSLSIPLGTVKSRLHAATAHFARRWTAEHDPAAIKMPRRVRNSRKPRPDACPVG
jgi:RNA polymerase sigma-70 factor (ECF subfamily)